MIKEFKIWFINEVLPIWAKEELLRENAKLQKKVQEQEIHIKQLNAYIDGLEAGIKAQRRIVIHNRSEIVKLPEAVCKEVSE